MPEPTALHALPHVPELPPPPPAALLTEPLLTAADVAALLAVPRSSVYEYARLERDPLPALRIGRHVRFERDEVARWLRERRPSR